MSLLSDHDARTSVISSGTRGRPPLPPSHVSSSDNKPGRTEGQRTSEMLPRSKPQAAVRSLNLHRQNSLVEKISMETQKHLEQEKPRKTPPEPQPRRRLASFGGISTTGMGTYNQNNIGNKPPGTGSDLYIHLNSSLDSRGSTGSLKLSPQSSGRTTLVTNLGSIQLQHVRDQMVIALQRLKELEEQVKIIPILQVKISILQEEKRQLSSQIKNQNGDDIHDVLWDGTYSMGMSDGGQGMTDTVNMMNTKDGVRGIMQSDCTNLIGLRHLTEEIQEVEQTVQCRNALAEDGEIHNAVVSDKNVDTTLFKTTKESKCVYTEPVETRSIATEVTEIDLDIYTEREAELDAQQILIEAMRERICHLEVELKESALQTEMSRLKLELQATGARNRLDKASIARPSTVSTGTQAGIQTTSQASGNHTVLQDASTGEEKRVTSVGVSCHPELKNVSTGPDVPMSHRNVTEQVEQSEHIVTGMQGTRSKNDANYRSVACGDCSVDVIVIEAKELVSHGMATDPVRCVELGIMATPKTASRRTNTDSSSVSRFTNTTSAFNTDSSTNTLLRTQDKYTNTAHTITRSVSVGNRYRDISVIPETRSVGVGSAMVVGQALKQLPVTMSKVTRDTGVGFTNINENFLVGLKTRNMASGPSHLPDPIKTKSIGVGEGRIRDLTVSCQTTAQKSQYSVQSQWDPELNHYIEKLQRFLREHQELLSLDQTKKGKEFVQQQSSQGNSRSTPSCDNNATLREQTGLCLVDVQSPANMDLQLQSQISLSSWRSDRGNPGMCHQSSNNDSEVKRMIELLEQQTSSVMQDRPSKSSVLRSAHKKENRVQACSSNRKNMKFLGVTTGLDPVSFYEFSASEENQQRGNRTLKESYQDGLQARKSKCGSNKGQKGSAAAAAHKPQRCKISENMFSACQALRMHLSDSTALSSRELHDCLQTLQREWFSVSSQKSALPDTVEDYLCTFHLISPSVLQHIVNMADGNGNTALHYSVSHSNFGVVKKILDAGVCNVNHQNKAGYTPIMLAALAAVETPEDMKVVQELFKKGDVNAKASQAGQTALMLAVSHGRMDVVQALLAQGAEVNTQDDEGSTALMCASEHGHIDIVKLLLAQPDCDATLTDSDKSTAMTIALETGHNDIAVLLYAHTNFAKGQTGATARLGGKSLPCFGGRNLFE